MLPKFERPVRFDLGALPDSGDSLRELLELESAEFDAVLGQPLSFDRDPTDAQSDVWQVLVDGSAPSSKLEAAPGQRLVLTLPSLADLDDGLNLLHSLAYSPSSVVLHEEATSYAAAFDRIHDEVANIYPYFELRGLDWEDITDRHRHVRELQGSAFWEGAHEWIAELGDAHTQLLCPTPRYHPPVHRGDPP